MAGTTPIYSFPYQGPNDPPDGAALGLSLAEAVETAVDGLDDRLDVLEPRVSAKPLVRLNQAVAHNLVHNTVTALVFTTEDIDTHGFHTNGGTNSRITPTLAGYYRFRAVASFSSRSDYAQLQISIGKNGAAQAPSGRQVPPLIAGIRAVEAEAILPANGTTDYFEALALQANTGSATVITNVSGSSTSSFECEWLRPL